MTKRVSPKLLNPFGHRACSGEAGQARHLILNSAHPERRASQWVENPAPLTVPFGSPDGVAPKPTALLGGADPVEEDFG